MKLQTTKTMHPKQHNLALVALAALWVSAALGQLELSASLRVDPIANPFENFVPPFENLAAYSGINKLTQMGKTPDGDQLHPIDYFIEDVLPPLVGMRPNNENGTRVEHKHYALSDTSNDDAFRLSAQELITRSGFKYELYDAVADDGYITTLTRLINPLADRSKLHKPPVLMEHGGTIDPTAYLIASSIQHFPEKWPRSLEDGPIRSWNRSLAFVLANNGFDVFLAATRGADDANTRRLSGKTLKSFLDGRNEDKNMTQGENLRQLLDTWNFWSFSQDDLIAHELKSHMDAVFKVTGSKKLHLFTFSLSTPTSLAFLSTRPDYAERVEGYVSMAPIVSGYGASQVTRLVFELICPALPDHLGTLVVTDLVLTQPIRELLVLLGRLPEFRYSLMKVVTTLAMGSSPKYETLIDLNLLGHLLRRLSFRELKQMCQQMKANALQKYDYGPLKNQLIYKSFKPPVYDLSNLKIRDWIIVAAPNDALSTPQVVDHLISMVNPKPIARFEAPGFNHLDLFAGWDNDKYVNIPVLRYFEQMSYDESGRRRADSKRSVSNARGLDFGSIFPPDMQPLRLLESGVNATRRAGLSAQPAFPLDARSLFDELSKNMRQMMSSFGESIGKVLVGGASSAFSGEASQRAAAGSAKQSDDKQSGANKTDEIKEPSKTKSTARSQSGTAVDNPFGRLPLINLPQMPTFEGVANLNNMSQAFGNMQRLAMNPREWNLFPTPATRAP